MKKPIIKEDQPLQPPMTEEKYWQLMHERLIRQGYAGEDLNQRLQEIKARGTTFQFDKNEILHG